MADNEKSVHVHCSRYALVLLHVYFIVSAVVNIAQIIVKPNLQIVDFR